MNRETALKLKTYFDEKIGPKRARNVRPVKITYHITDKQTVEYFGVEWDRIDHYQPHERHVTEGGKKAGDEYTVRQYELLGVRHKVMQARKRVAGNELCCKFVWRQDGDATESDWHFCHWWEGAPSEPYHTFGAEFGMSRWPHENPWHKRIDQYDDEKRERKKFSVEYLD